MSYIVKIMPSAEKAIKKWKKSNPNFHNKFLDILSELGEHPRTGIGHPEQLKGDRSGQWSRTITKKHRLIYEIHETEVIVIVLTAYGHYGDM